MPVNLLLSAFVEYDKWKARVCVLVCVSVCVCVAP